MLILLRSQLNAKISLYFEREFENDHSKLRIFVDSRLENQRMWRFVLTSTLCSLFSLCSSCNITVDTSSLFGMDVGAALTALCLEEPPVAISSSSHSLASNLALHQEEDTDYLSGRTLALMMLSILSYLSNIICISAHLHSFNMTPHQGPVTDCLSNPQSPLIAVNSSYRAELL